MARDYVVSRLVRTTLAFLIPLLWSTQALPQTLKKLYQLPSADGSFVRVVNATASPLRVRLFPNAQKEISLNAGAATNYQFARSPGDIDLFADGQVVARKLPVPSGRFITFAVTTKLDARQVKTIDETGFELKGLQAELRFYNLLDCAATLRTSDGVTIFESVPPYEVRRRFVNPVTATVSASCASSHEAKLQLTTLQADIHFSIFLFGEAQKPNMAGQIDGAQYDGTELR